ncbi:hypothetical protein [Streptomyces naphthomycinicus]|uniref:hypothetical protein n=1 Tax=Streptomyces naphthomycinicus TaxID=2872625 RepID=UPI001CEC15FE|nr:hypothetical protein [Streptomyces sp. TML10]
MNTATTELRRFLTITGHRFNNSQSAPEMFSPAEDAAWHELLGTPACTTLCLCRAGTTTDATGVRASPGATSGTC